MSKWSKRSPDEKARILAEQEALRNKGKEPSFGDMFNNDNQTEILKRNEIPIVCETHGFTTSGRYELVEEEHPLIGGKQLFVRGRCVKCGRTSRRALGLDESSMMLMLIIRMLQDKGRVDDLR